MARNDNAKLLRDTPWASGDTGAGNREEIPAALRLNGWDVQYSAPGGKVPERLLVNQLLHELTALCMELNTRGPFLPWSPHVNYAHPAFVMGEDGDIRVSVVSSGPARGNASDPDTDADGAVWRLY